MTWKALKWFVWITMAAILIFCGWIIKDKYSADLGKSLMGMGWILTGFLIIYAAYKNLK